MKYSRSRKFGVAVVLILTSLALIIPSVAILLSVYESLKSPQQTTIDPSQITIETVAPNADEEITTQKIQVHPAQ